MGGEASDKKDETEVKKEVTNYGINERQEQYLNNAFVYHPPFGDQQNRYVLLRTMAKEYAKMIMMYSPQSREQSLALTNLENSVMWANAAIARNERPGEQTKKDN